MPSYGGGSLPPVTPSADLNALLDDIGTAAHRVGGNAERPPHYHEVIVIYDRCRGLFKAVHTLVREELGEEALILTRPMFTESLMLMDIAAAEEPTRISQLARWSITSLNHLAGVMREGESRGRDETESLANIDARRAQIIDYASKAGVRLPRNWPPHEKQLADRHGRGEEYLDFCMHHHFVHGSSFATRQRSVRKGDLHVVGDPDARDPAWARNAALSASQSMLFAMQAVSRIFGWPGPRELAALNARVQGA